MAVGARVLLLEIINADQFPGRISGSLPFIRGYLDANAVPARWIRFAISTTNLLENERDEITLSPDELGRLLDVARDLAPTHLVTTDPLCPAQLAEVRREAPGVAVVAQEDFTGLPGLPQYESAVHLVDPGFAPAYAWQAGNAAAERREHDNVYLHFRERCGHRRPAKAIALYRALGDRRAAEHRGCTFCDNWRTFDEHEELTTPAGWIGRQVDAIARSRGAPERFPNAILLTVLPAPRLLEECLEAMRRNGMVGRVRLLFGNRVDQVPWVARILREALADESAGRLSAGVYATGIESFDERDLAIFNKGTTPAQGVAALNTYRDLAEEHPGRFSYTGVSFLLFTPWTSLEGLRLNYGLLSLLRATGKEAGNVFQARLRLHEGLPVTALAERDGLVVGDEEDPVLRMNRRKLFASERAWEFRDPRLRPLSRIVLRYDLLRTRLADDLAAAVERRLREAYPHWRGGDDPTPSWEKGDDGTLLAFTNDLLDVLLEAGDAAPAEPEALLAAAVEQARLRRRRAAGDARRHRVGEEALDLGGVLARLAPVIRAGEQSVLAVRDVAADELPAAAGALAGLPRALLPPRGGERRGTLLVAADEATLRERVRLAQALDAATDAEARAAAALGAAALHGQPPCCAAAHARSPFAGLGLSPWAAVALRATHDGAVPAALHPLLVPALGFVPCAPGCPAAAARHAALLAAAACAVPEDAAAVIELDGPGDGELVLLRGARCEADRVRYDPGAIGEGAGAARALLRRGDAVVPVPGQLRVVRGGTPVGALTASHALWHPARAWHGDFWRELARASVRAARDRARETEERPRLERRRPTPPQGPAREGAFRIAIRDAAGGDGGWVFHVAPHRAGDRFFRRVGRLVLWYEHRGLPPRAAACARAIVSAMNELGREPCLVDRLDRWRSAVPRALVGAGMGGCECAVEWYDHASRPA